MPSDPNGPMVDYTEFYCEVCASIFWILNALCFVFGDSIRVVSFRREMVEQKKDKAQEQYDLEKPG